MVAFVDDVPFFFGLGDESCTIDEETVESRASIGGLLESRNI
jgi:hypothetical protein